MSDAELSIRIPTSIAPSVIVALAQNYADLKRMGASPEHVEAAQRVYQELEAAFIKSVSNGAPVRKLSSAEYDEMTKDAGPARTVEIPGEDSQ